MDSCLWREFGLKRGVQGDFSHSFRYGINYARKKALGARNVRSRIGRASMLVLSMTNHIQ